MQRGRGWLANAFICFVLGVPLGLGSPVATASEPLAARQKAAREAVDEALQREVYGLQAERQALLHEAERQDPVLKQARWHQGLVQTATGAWVKPEEFSVDRKIKILLVEYREIRDKTADTLQAHLAMANWCSAKGLRDQERAHLWRVAQLEPDHAEARRRLGHQRVGQEWFTAADAAEASETLKRHEAAAAEYRQPLTQIIADLRHRSLARQEAGRKKFAEIGTDPRTVPVIEELFGRAGNDLALLAVERLGQIEGEEAAAALCRFALGDFSEEVRQAAAGQLSTRNQVEYAPQLLEMLTLPLRSQFVAVPVQGGVAYRHVVLSEGHNRREVAVQNRTFETDYVPVPIRVTNAPGRIRALRNAQAVAHVRLMRSAAETAAEREAEISQANQIIGQRNHRIMEVLSWSTGERFVTPVGWWGWWSEVEDRMPGEKYLKIVEDFRKKKLQATFYAVNPHNPSCFAAGTQVWTIDGLAAVESLRVGDLVLSKDIDTGELTYKPVIGTTVRPPGPLVTFNVGEEQFKTSRGHLFWEPGTGWVQARRITEGMILHTANDPTRVTAVGQEAPEPTYNLVVDEFNTYFVGDAKLLSHDVTGQQATSVTVPGLVVD